MGMAPRAAYRFLAPWPPGLLGEKGLESQVMVCGGWSGGAARAPHLVPQIERKP